VALPGAALGASLAGHACAAVPAALVVSTVRLLKKLTERPKKARTPQQEAEDAWKVLRKAKDKAAQRRAAEALEKALKKLKEGLK
jgi:hypothetical protein